MKRLEKMEEGIKKGGGTGKTIVAGDFNAKARLWGSKRECSKGKILCEWAAAMDLRIVNRGTISTCIKGKGESIVDLTWITRKAKDEIKGWKVTGNETLLDHEMIQFEIGRGSRTKNGTRKDMENRWAVRKMNKDKLMEVVIGNTWILGEEKIKRGKRVEE